MTGSGDACASTTSARSSTAAVRPFGLPARLPADLRAALMSAEPAPAGLVAGLDVLQRALDYTRAALATITCPTSPARRPCAGWTLADLLPAWRTRSTPSRRPPTVRSR